jgi:hypothetical protein
VGFGETFRVPLKMRATMEAALYPTDEGNKTWQQCAVKIRQQWKQDVATMCCEDEATRETRRGNNAL